MSLLSKLTGLKIDKKIIKGSIDLLKVFLSTSSLKDFEIKRLLQPFYMTQAIRSEGVAHRAGTNFKKSLVKFGLAELSNKAKMRRVINEFNQSLSILMKILES